MTLGPLEYLVVGFEGTQFTGQILAELRAARDKGIIRVVDLFAIKKDDQGNVTALELSDLSDEEATELGPLAGDLMGLFAPEDIEQAAASIPNNGAAGLLLFEHTWAIGLKEAIKNAGGVAIAGGFVAPDVLKSWSKTSRRRSRVPGRNKQQRKLLSSFLKKEKTYDEKKKTTLKDRRGRRGCLCSGPSYGQQIGSTTAAGCPAERTD